MSLISFAGPVGFKSHDKSTQNKLAQLPYLSLNSESIEISDKKDEKNITLYGLRLEAGS